MDRILVLNGHGIKVWVDAARLKIRDGQTGEGTPHEWTFRPKRIGIDNLVIYGRSGSFTLDAARWLIKHGTQVTLLDWNGKLLTTMLPPGSVAVQTKFCQYKASEDDSQRLFLAKKFIEAKFCRTTDMLSWLKERYPQVEENLPTEAKGLQAARNAPEILRVEAVAAQHYWSQIAKILPEKAGFMSRGYRRKPWGSGDPTNTLLNYLYSILEAEVLRAINTAGLDPHVGFLHKTAPGKNSLAYDLQEPFRFLTDLAVLALTEQGTMQPKDFIRTETYTLKLRPSGAKKAIREFNRQLGKKTTYKGKTCSWKALILNKTTELAHHLNGKRKTLDLTKPRPVLDRQDTEAIRKKILAISYSEWEKRGYSRGSLHYMKKNAEGNESFSLNTHILKRLASF
ncbi:MAG: CRISPR-associated endonuclease Cas1 [archaeon]